MSYGIYLSAKNDKEGFRLPINPEEVRVTRSGDGETFKIARLGSVNVPKAPDLQEFEFESYFPAEPTHYSETDFLPPQYYIDKLNSWLDAREPIRYIYVNGSFSINEKVTIEDFEYSESYGTADVDFSIELKRYVDFGPKQLKIEKPKTPTAAKKPAKATSSKKPARQTQKVVPQTYVLVKGDSLWKVAQKYTGKGNNYPALAKLNNIKPSQYRRLPIGLKLKIPPEWTKKK
ncbi:LysM peptidoglycan-binding domain-containing protein [Sporosarcina trichiuri]|uniref:LysM peptidoglycan-binding domain-containing protein n=1 Tax=Sporosarcina trichiuri TaxID=3056445 RepID=UPI0025B2CBE2|nr:LysM peptidoglycan-binding domain-containing protein [Sporosarcina sp. 0.2-SM1T-5]WJY27481.1 LysM peptidoglycan-binding domain-containing protein [Sporosarcina sp. 0.2-SM1T-5]